MSIDHTTTLLINLLGMPEAFQRAYGPTKPFGDEFGELEVQTPRNYGFDSQVEYHHTALTLLDPTVAQVQAPFGPIPFIDHDGTGKPLCRSDDH